MDKTWMLARLKQLEGQLAAAQRENAELRALLAKTPGDALSEACVRYGRLLAGLPELVSAQVAPPVVPTPEGED